jgi:hypothetical protein
MVNRADLTGAINALLSPFFSANVLPKIGSSVLNSSKSQTSDLRALLESLPISHSLTRCLFALSSLSSELALIMESKKLTDISTQLMLLKTTYAIRYALLDSPNLLYPGSQNLDFENIDLALEQQKTLEEVLRLGSLLYIQATLQEFPLAAVGSRNLVRRLMESVMLVRINGVKQGELVVWLLMVGGMEAKFEDDRTWFVQQLDRLTRRLGIVDWGMLICGLESLWWIGRVHDTRGRRLWGEVKALTIL